MEKNNQYTNMVTAIEDLSRKGYTGNFSVTEDGLLDDGNGNTFCPLRWNLMNFIALKVKPIRQIQAFSMFLKQNPE
jgi:hypothetical protein